MARHLMAVIAGFLVLAVTASADDRAASVSIRDRIQRHLTDKSFPPKIYIDGERLHAAVHVQQFYARRDFAPLWIWGRTLNNQIYILLHVIQNSDMEGLTPEDYHLRRIVYLLGRTQPDPKVHPGVRVGRLAALELLLTDAFFMVAEHLRHGRVDPESFYNTKVADKARWNMEDALEMAVGRSDLRGFFRSCQPPHGGYRALVKAARRYHGILMRNTWPEISEGPPLQRGDLDARVEALRMKLDATGDFTHPDASDPRLFSAALEAAVQTYQRRHALPATGVLDEATRAALNVPVAERLRQLTLNLERWRWLPDALGETYLWVNIPDFSLHLIDHGRLIRSMRVVVGRQYRQTPEFSGRLSHLVLNPYWDIPPNILVEDKLDALRRDADFFSKRAIRVFDGWREDALEIDPATIDWTRISIRDLYERFRFRQAPGPNNPLGRVKFMFPNAFAVYLHDTPQRNLFEKEIRDFSSGCIRLEDPMGLAEALLDLDTGNDDTWTPERLEALLTSSEDRVMKLTGPLFVHILYFTVWVDTEGRVQFRPDLYKRDAALDEAFHTAPLMSLP